MLLEFGVFLALAFGALGWALHTFLIVLAWLNGGPSWNAQGAYNRIQEGPLEIGVLLGVTLFVLFLSGVYFQRLLGSKANAFLGGHSPETRRATAGRSLQGSSRGGYRSRLPGLLAGVWRSSRGRGNGYGKWTSPSDPDAGRRARAPAATPQHSVGLEGAA